MKHAFQITWISLRDTYEEMFILVGVNLLTLLLCIPVVTAPPALAGLHNLGFFIATEKRIELSVYWQGFRENLLYSWKLAALNIFIFGVLGWDIWFYLGKVQSSWRVLGFVGIWILVIWLVAQLYIFPFLVRMEERKIFPLAKNAVLLTLAYPVFSLTAALLLVLLLALSIILPILFILIGLSFAAVMGAHALRHGLEMVEEFRERQKDDLDEE